MCELGCLSRANFEKVHLVAGCWVWHWQDVREKEVCRAVLGIEHHPEGMAKRRVSHIGPGPWLGNWSQLLALPFKSGP